MKRNKRMLLLILCVLSCGEFAQAKSTISSFFVDKQIQEFTRISVGIYLESMRSDIANSELTSSKKSRQVQCLFQTARTKAFEKNLYDTMEKRVLSNNADIDTTQLLRLKNFFNSKDGREILAYGVALGSNKLSKIEKERVVDKLNSGYDSAESGFELMKQYKHFVFKSIDHGQLNKCEI